VKSISLYEFGGGEDTVRQIQKPFVEYFRGCSPVLDVGCGRGIFLDLLSTAGVEAVGIDHSAEALAVCQQKGFIVQREDASTYLKQNSGRFGGIFCHKALRRKGVLLVVTPNPTDLCIMSEVFWLDPTHVRPYPGPLLEKMLRAIGFEIRVTKQFLGSWRLIGKSGIPGFLLRRMLLGHRFGKPNTLVLAAKE
jgi:SAM-dependent methyltransferase